MREAKSNPTSWVQSCLFQDIPMKEDNSITFPGLWCELNGKQPARCLTPTW